MDKKPWVLWLGLLGVLVGLVWLVQPPAEPTPVAFAPTVTQTSKATSRPGTATLWPSSTPSPTPSPMPSVSPSPAPSFTPTPRPTASPRPTYTPTITPTPTATPLPPTIMTNGRPMVLVMADYFIMGVEPDVLVEECALFGLECPRSLFEPVAPQHPVWLDAFYIDQYEVTNGAFAVFLAAQGNSCLGYDCLVLAGSQIEQNGTSYGVVPGREQYPVFNVTWYGAAAFCAWRGGRLPSEAEWEKAASWATLTNSKSLYPWGNQFDGSRVNFCDANCPQAQANGAYHDGYAQTAPVGSYPLGRSPAGAEDMAGNVWEWVGDWFSPRYYAYSAQMNPAGPATGQIKVVRGGSWLDSGNFSNTLFRAALNPALGTDSVGFRCALSVGD